MVAKKCVDVNDSIPKIIHQLWLGDKPVPFECRDWRSMNPDWEYRFWTDKEVLELMEESPMKHIFYAYYNNPSNPHAGLSGASNIFRIELLYKFGGLYMDADSLALKPLDNNLPTEGFWITKQSARDGDVVACGIMASCKQHPMFGRMRVEISQLNANAMGTSSGNLTNQTGQSCYETGPYFFTKHVKRSDLIKEKITILDSVYFLPLRWDETGQMPPESYACHNWHGARRKQMQVGSYVLNAPPNGISSILPLFGKGRIPNIQVVIKSWLAQVGNTSNAELIVCEPEGEPLLDDYTGIRRVTLQPKNSKYPLRELRNLGVREAIYNLVEFHDCDVLYAPGWVAMALYYAHYEPMFSGFCEVWKLPEKLSEQIRANPIGTRFGYRNDLLNVKKDEVWRAITSGGCGMTVCFRKEILEMVGGWNENMTGWGADDNELGARCKKVIGYWPFDRALPVNVLHLWHPLDSREHHLKNKNIALAVLASQRNKSTIQDPLIMANTPGRASDEINVSNIEKPSVIRTTVPPQRNRPQHHQFIQRAKLTKPARLGIAVRCNF